MKLEAVCMDSCMPPPQWGPLARPGGPVPPPQGAAGGVPNEQFCYIPLQPRNYGPGVDWFLAKVPFGHFPPPGSILAIFVGLHPNGFSTHPPYFTTDQVSPDYLAQRQVGGCAKVGLVGKEAEDQPEAESPPDHALGDYL